MRLLLLTLLAVSPAQAPGPEARSLLGRPLFAPPIPDERRQRLEKNLAQAEQEARARPDDADALIWLGRRTAYLGRFREAIAVFTRGREKHPGDARFLRHRGHRYISVRELDKAVADLTRAGEMLRGRPDEVEPDGEPNALGIPTSTLHFNVWYHLGLAHYLRGDFEAALFAYRRCLEVSRDSPDRLVATSDWLYMGLRRLGRDDEARQVLAPITAELKVIENHAYWNRLLMYKGETAPEDLLGQRQDGVELATYG
ncbi:MAG TPA: tetratricopeptide repeat protein, partial [Methylomirabilota bacterium]|nr:tetratricopeptide repeat protein [Methylomirabilota bacterium]